LRWAAEGALRRDLLQGSAGLAHQSLRALDTPIGNIFGRCLSVRSLEHSAKVETAEAGRFGKHLRIFIRCEIASTYSGTRRQERREWLPYRDIDSVYRRVTSDPHSTPEMQYDIMVVEWWLRHIWWPVHRRSIALHNCRTEVLPAGQEKIRAQASGLKPLGGKPGEFAGINETYHRRMRALPAFAVPQRSGMRRGDIQACLARGWIRRGR
jgi:hypothetical protein